MQPKLILILFSIFRSFLFPEKMQSSAGGAEIKPVTRLNMNPFKMSKCVRKNLSTDARTSSRVKANFQANDKEEERNEVILIVQCKFTAILFDYIVPKH